MPCSIAGWAARRSAVAGCMRRKTPRSRSQSRPRAANSARMVAVVIATKPSIVSMCDLLCRTGKLFDMSVATLFAGVGLGLIVTRDLRGGGVCRIAKNLREFLGALAEQSDAIADADAGEEVLDVAIAQANAAMRSVLADGGGAIRAVNAEALNAQTHPARAKWIAGAGADDHAGLVVAGILEALRDLEFSGGAGALRGADGDGVELDEAAVFEEGQLAVGDADNDAANWGGLRGCGRVGNRLRGGRGGERECQREEHDGEPRVGLRSRLVCFWLPPHGVCSFLPTQRGMAHAMPFVTV